MISDHIHGAVPLDAADLPTDSLLRLLLRLQDERVTLTTAASDTRTTRDEINAALRKAKADAESEARATLPPGRGSTEPAATAIKAFVDAHPVVIDGTDTAAEAARMLATIDDRLGVVRSGLRVIGAIIEHRQIERREALAAQAEASAKASW